MLSAGLPQELLELILDQIPLNQAGRRALASCLLVSRYFCQLSRSRLFSHLEVNPDHDKKVTALRKLLEYDAEGPNHEKDGFARADQASLIHCVKSVKIIWSTTAVTYIRFVLTGNGNATFNTFGVEDFEAILHIFAESQTLQALVMLFTTREPTEFLDIMKLKLIMQSFQKILNSPSIERLALTNLSSIPHDAFDIWKIKDLALLDVTVTNRSLSEFFQDAATSNDITTPIPPTSSQLQSFTYVFQHPLPSQWLSSPSPFSHLSTLTAKFDYPSLSDAFANPHFDSFLTLSGSNLRSLHIDFDNVSTTPFTYIFDLFPHSLQHLTALRAVKYTVHSFFHSDWEVDGVVVDQLTPGQAAIRTSRNAFGRTGDVVKSLDTFESDRVPETLHTIEVEFRVRAARSVGVRFRRESDWHELGNKLMESRFASVERIGITLIVEIKTPAIGERLDENAPFVADFPCLWKDRYPSIPVKVVKVEMWREGSM